VGIDISPSTVAAILFSYSALVLGYLIGAYREWDKANTARRQLFLELEDSYRDADNLRSIIFESGSVRSQSHNPAQKLTSI
jgi:hypothetical protein